MARKKKVLEPETYVPVMNSDIEVGTKVHVKMIDGVGGLDIYGTVVYIHEKHFAFSYIGGTHENLAVAPLPTFVKKDDYYEIIK